MDRGRPKRFLYGTSSIVNGSMQRAKIFTVCRQAKRASLDALQGIHGRNNLQHRELIGRPHDLESAAASALRSNKTGARKQPQDLSQIVGGNVRIRRNFLDSQRIASGGGQSNHSPESVFDSLREHFSIYDNWIRLSTIEKAELKLRAE